MANVTYSYFRDRDFPTDVARMAISDGKMWGEEWNGEKWVESDSGWRIVSDYMNERIDEEKAKEILGIE